MNFLNHNFYSKWRYTRETLYVIKYPMWKYFDLRKIFVQCVLQFREFVSVFLHERITIGVRKLFLRQAPTLTMVVPWNYTVRKIQNRNCIAWTRVVLTVTFKKPCNVDRSSIDDEFRKYIIVILIDNFNEHCESEISRSILCKKWSIDIERLSGCVWALLANSTWSSVCQR